MTATARSVRVVSGSMCLTTEDGSSDIHVADLQTRTSGYNFPKVTRGSHKPKHLLPAHVHASDDQRMLTESSKRGVGLLAWSQRLRNNGMREPNMLLLLAACRYTR